MQTGITQMEFVAYQGTNEAARAVMSGEVLMTIGDAAVRVRSRAASCAPSRQLR